ncbi:MAG: hypothetical protein COB81_05110 [Flavobacteriaceae bacterium]|nr:MAG: hypothetical protein COB81_05110 [Flavobacteriaceae bacterium]
MKKILIGLIIFLFYSCSTTKNAENRTNDSHKEKPLIYDYADKINDEQLKFIKESYNWNNEKILIISYIQPIAISTCNINYKTIPDSGKKWREDFYSKINTEDCLKIEVLANGEKVKNILDNIIYFDDKNDFLYDNFFNRKKSCFGIMVVNNDGFYIQYNGHYSERQVAKFIENLKT